MKFRSVRLRIAFLSAVLAGAGLIGFGMVAWRLIYLAKVSRLDAKLETQVRRSVRPRSPDWWPPFIAALPQELETEADTPIVLLVIDANGQPLYDSNLKNSSLKSELNLRSLLPLLPASPPSALSPPIDPPPDPPIDPVFGELPPEPHIVTRQAKSGSWRVAAVSSSYAQGVIAVSLQAIDQEMSLIRHIFLLVIPGTLLLVAGGAWGLAGRALRPIRSLTATIRQVTVSGLDQQVPVDTTDIEFVELLQVFNQMLKRLERSFKQASRFSGDAAHELKTPLAILQGELEQLLQQAEPGSEMQQSLSNLLDEVRRLSAIVRKLLLLSLADAGQMSLHKIAVNIAELLTPIVEDIDLLAPHLTVQTHFSDELWVLGDRDLLTQVLQNLVSNAIKYNLSDGWIKIEGQQQKDTVQITFTNAANPMPALDHQRIFDRFYRGDPARTRKVEGVGLGLSLSREIAQAHSGDLILNSTPADWVAFTLILPARTGDLDADVAP